MASVDSTIQLVRIQTEEGAGLQPARKVTVCDTALAEGPWMFDAQPPSYGPGASVADRIPANAPRQGGLPQEYRTASAAELNLRIRAARRVLGERVVM